jgi:hypothetical protein
MLTNISISSDMEVKHQKKNWSSGQIKDKAERQDTQKRMQKVWAQIQVVLMKGRRMDRLCHETPYLIACITDEAPKVGNL